MGKFSEYKLPLKSMPAGINQFEYKLGKTFFSNMENTDIRDANLSVGLTVKNMGNLYEMTFDITGEIVLLCDRCLEDLHQDVNANYHINIKYGDAYCDNSDELLIIPEQDSYLNVAYMIYDTIVLSIPAKHVHPQGKCNRVMSALLHKYQTNVDDEFDNGMIDGLDDLDLSSETDQRWNKLKEIYDNN